MNLYLCSINKKTMILAVDVGNTRVKAAVFEGAKSLRNFYFEREKFRNKIQDILDEYVNISDLVVASVGNIDKNEFFIFENKVKIHQISNLDAFPFQNLYNTPLTLGVDRMVLAAGAVLQFSKINRLVIDAGTCITYDFIDSEDNYQGGAISPGLRLRYESLHHFTAKLPLLEFENQETFIGKSTHESIHSGVINGFVYEIDGFIEEYKKRYPEIKIILTGGDAEFLANRLKNTIFANSNFLLESLNLLYQYQKRQ
ncbi:MAG: type III pantothenate kinase [Flavobacterium sp.]